MDWPVPRNVIEPDKIEAKLDLMPGKKKLTEFYSKRSQKLGRQGLMTLKILDINEN